MILSLIEREELNSLKVKISNSIIKGKFDYTACQLDILFALICSLKDGQLKYEIHLKDLENLTNHKWDYQQFKNSTAELGSRMFEIETEDRYRQFWLFSYFEYIPKFGKIEIKINEDSKDLFFNLKKNFTPISLLSILKCSSKYAKRLYMEICSWRNYNIKYGKDLKPMRIVDLKLRLGLINPKTGSERYPRISDFQKIVLEPAKTQINKFTDMNFDYELIKQGRSFEYIKFILGKKRQKGKKTIH